MRSACAALVALLFFLACEGPKSNVKRPQDGTKKPVAKADIEELLLQRELAAKAVAIVDTKGATFFIEELVKKGDTLEEACKTLMIAGVMERESWGFFYDLEFDPLELFEGVETECAGMIEGYRLKQK